MSNIKKIILVIATLALVIAGVAFALRSGLFLGSSGATHYQKESFVEGLFAGKSREVEITRTGDVNIGGGTLNVRTANTATSTIIGGCFQFYATSTATALKFQASTTPGVMYSQYGSCPNL